MMVSLDLKGRPVLVIGTGPEALARSRALAGEGAQVTLVSKVGISERGELGGMGFSLHSKFRKRDLKGIFLVIATDRNKVLNSWLAKQTKVFGFLLNTLDEKETSNFYNVAIRRVAPSVEVAVSTGGVSPAFASRLSSRLASYVKIEDLAVLEAFIETRNALRNAGQSTFNFDWIGLEAKVRSGIASTLANYAAAINTEDQTPVSVVNGSGVQPRMITHCRQLHSPTIS